MTFNLKVQDIGVDKGILMNSFSIVFEIAPQVHFVFLRYNYGNRVMISRLKARAVC
jgi:hypothetical protein